jgi:hypothetical protein
MDPDEDIKKENEVMRLELNSILINEAPKTCKFLNEYIERILKMLLKSDMNEQTNNFGINNTASRINLTTNNQGLEGIKCSLNMNGNELRNIEINYKPSTRHNNYIYKSKEDCAWNLYQISNCADILKSVLIYIQNINFKVLDEAALHFDHLIESINTARNILIFPKKRSIIELQNQKNMKIFKLVPNELVFSFYIQSYKLILCIYILKGNESTKHILECNTINWLNNIMILLTTVLHKLQQMKDKLNFFEQINSQE